MTSVSWQQRARLSYDYGIFVDQLTVICKLRHLPNSREFSKILAVFLITFNYHHARYKGKGHVYFLKQNGKMINKHST